MGSDEQARSIFPSTDLADEDGLLCFGGRLDVPTLVDAYSHGIFPWPSSDRTPVPWFSPPMRGILRFEELHVQRRLAQFIRNMKWTTTVNQNFAGVIRGCASQKRRGGTWITQGMIDAYVKLHEAGFALSVEVWDVERLVGGIYGVLCGGVFSAESMFHAEDNASKVALVRLVEHLQSLGHAWMDIQMVTETTEKFGAREVGREEFQRMCRDRRASAG
jgi:leucyl/phenylalanyl-tRNA--protein transferase